jgi:signal transduction histidine kinase
MSIRRKLFSFILVMMIFLLVNGAFLFVGGRIIVGAFRHSLESANSLNTIRELKTHMYRQRASLNQYLLVGDSSELINFEEASKQSAKTLEALKSQYNRVPAWYTTLLDKFTSTNLVADQVTLYYKQGNKARAYDEATGKLLPKFQELFTDVQSLEQQKEKEAQQLFITARSWSDKAGILALVILGTAFFFGFFLFRSLYNSVMDPLETLRNGAAEFGKGHWDHKIDLAAQDNEFGSLAAAFNTMADNVKQLQEQAIHMDRMSAVGQLAGGVAHEINNPLTGVLGQAQILLAKISPDQPMYNQLKKIEQAALRCKKIVRGLLDFSRPGQVKFDDVDVNEILTQTIELCEADIKSAKVVLEKKLAKTLPKTEANSSELQQVLLNLINNALQAMPRGGTLSLETRTHNQSLTFVDRRKGAPPYTANGPWVEISVRDTGVGIAKDHLSRVFEPFFTTKEIGKGTGLGLSVSMGIVRKHGGDLSVDSPGLNRGATFRLTIPVKGTAGAKMGERSSKMAA